MSNTTPGDWENVPTRILQTEDVGAGTLAPTLAPTNSAFVTSTDSEIIRETFRIYGSIYLGCFLLFCILRKTHPKLFNIRSWVPELKCDLAITQHYGFFSWSWKVFSVSDDDLLENCGMDALCFLRCLRLGAKLSLWGAFNAMWLIPLYFTAEESPETANLEDLVVLMSIANLPNKSNRFVGPVVAAYLIVLFSMHLIVKEYDWYTEYRHKYLSKRVPRNYAVYVSGIPKEYRSSYALADYFRRCSWGSAVMEADIAIDIPSLEAKVARREKVLAKLEHTVALEQKKGRTQTHRNFRLRNGIDSVGKKVDSINDFQLELESLNNEIALAVGAITNSNHRLRQHLSRNEGSLAVQNGNSQILLPINESLETMVSGELSNEQTGDSSIDCQRLFRPNENRFTSSQGNSTGTLLTTAPSLSTIGNLEPISETPGTDVEHVEEHQEQHPQSGCLEEQPKSKASAQSSIHSNLLEGISKTCENLEHDDSQHPHPFLSIFGLDSSFFLPDHESPGRVLGGKSNSDVTIDTESLRGKKLEFDSASVSQTSLSDDIVDEMQNTQGDDEEAMENRDGKVIDKEAKAESDSNRSQQGGSSEVVTRSSKSSLSMGDSARSNTGSVTRSVKNVGSRSVHRVMRVGSGTKDAVKKAMQDVNAEIVTANLKKVGTRGVQSVRTAGSIGMTSMKRAVQQAPDLGASLAASAAVAAVAVVPLRLNKSEGEPREAGFVVFNDLYTTQATIQMLHHHSANKIQVEPAPGPDEVFWANVGLPGKARRSGVILSMFATSCLCFFWSIPSAFLSSLTEINSLKEKLPLLAEWIESVPAIETFLVLVAPLVLLLLNETLLPVLLKWFAMWEGHVSSSVLEASLFFKLCAFVIIQTFFISAVSGTITAELSNILDDPESIVQLLANSLPAQSSYFIQICFVFTFLLQGFDLLRVYPLGLAFSRRYFFGPNLTAKEKRKSWKLFSSLEDPPEFWHAEIMAQIMLFFVVFFVYSTIAPITSIFLWFCFVICESGYRYHFIHSHKTTPDSGGRLWRGFIQVLMASMLIGELTLVGLLILKKAVYALPALAPLLAITVLFMIFVIPKRNHVATHLPTMLCVELDQKNREQENAVALFAASKYLQPALRAGEPLTLEVDPMDISHGQWTTSSAM